MLLALIALSVVLILFCSTHTRKPYGSAHWANRREVKKAGLLSRKGIIVGKRGRRFLCADGYEHVLVLAPSGAGKGAGVVVPTLLTWPDSAVVLDVKNENYRLTSRFREKYGQKVRCFNPADPEGKTHCYNPLDAISRLTGQRINDVQKICHLLITTPAGTDPMWSNEARSLTIGLILYLLDTPEYPLTFGELLRLTKMHPNFVEFLQHVLQTRQDIDPVCFMNLNSFVQKAPKERSGVLSTLHSCLSLWANPYIDAATAKSDFDLSALRKERITVYVCVTPDNLERLAPLLNLFFQQTIDLLTRKEPDAKTEPYTVLMLLDEFTSLGRMGMIEKGIAFLRGYHIRLMPIIQDISQLESEYGQASAQTFMANAKVKVAYAPGNIKTATLISQMLGTQTIDLKSKSQKSTLMSEQSGSSTSTSHGKRELLMPHEVMQLPVNESIIMVEASAPVKARKIIYHKEKVFKQRLLPVPEIKAIEPVKIQLKSVSPVVADTVDVELSEAELEQLLVS